jgi:DMSO/TMAO reductase YedYZ molybdopterin-dependent catalytic subunit
MTDTLEARPSSAPTPPPRLPNYNAQRIGFTAGVAAAIVMLVAIVVIRAISGVISLPEVVAEGILVMLPGALFSAVLDSLQHAAKPLFYLAVGIGMLLVGGFLGRWYASSPGWKQTVRVVVGAWLVFGVGIYTILGAGIFGAQLQAGPIWHAGSLLIIFAVYGVALYEMFGALERRAMPSAGIDAGRRTVLRNAAVALVATIGAAGVWRLVFAGGAPSGSASAPEAAGRAASGAVASNPPPFDLAGMSPEVTPSKDFYTVSKNFIDPSVAVGGWRLKVDGLVERPIELTYDQLTAMPAVEGYYTLMCISNEIGGDLWGNAKWRGIKLADLLNQAGIKPGAVKAVFSAADDYKDSVTIDHALHPDAFLAWEMNGAPLANEHGYPARLLIPGIYGMKNVKWLTGITIVDNDFKGFWQSQGWDDAAPYQTESRIDAPRGRSTVSPGTLPLGGVAFAGDRGISSVEVSTDSGQTWQAATVKPGLSPYTWQLWRADVPVDRNVKTVRVRATDGQGHPQTRESNPPFPSGATGYDSITIAVS